jgi:hypothetical protein
MAASAKPQADLDDYLIIDAATLLYRRRDGRGYGRLINAALFTAGEAAKVQRIGTKGRIERAVPVMSLVSEIVKLRAEIAEMDAKVSTLEASLQARLLGRRFRVVCE